MVKFITRVLVLDWTFAMLMFKYYWHVNITFIESKEPYFDFLGTQCVNAYAIFMVLL